MVSFSFLGIISFILCFFLRETFKIDPGDEIKELLNKEIKNEIIEEKTNGEKN